MKRVTGLGHGQDEAWPRDDGGPRASADAAPSTAAEWFVQPPQSSSEKCNRKEILPETKDTFRQPGLHLQL